MVEGSSTRLCKLIGSGDFLIRGITDKFVMFPVGFLTFFAAIPGLFTSRTSIFGLFATETVWDSELIVATHRDSLWGDLIELMDVIGNDKGVRWGCIRGVMICISMADDCDRIRLNRLIRW